MEPERIPIFNAQSKENALTRELEEGQCMETDTHEKVTSRKQRKKGMVNKEC